MRKVVGFLDRQGIHIRPQANGPIALTSPKNTDDPCPAHPWVHLQPKFLKESRNLLSGPHFPEA